MPMLWILRALFIIVIIFAFIFNATSVDISGDNRNFWAVFWASFILAAIAFCVDVFTPKRKLSALAGVFFGLIVGILISAVLVPTVDVLVKYYQVGLINEAVMAIKWTLSICICYLTISVVMRTKDDVRFVVPYVEFAKQTKGAKPMILDTSVIIDGRIADLYQSKLFDAPLVVPKFVLNELQLISDSADKLKRNRGRRGLDILNKVQKDPTIDIEIDDEHNPEIEQLLGVDQKLVMFTKLHRGRLVTTDYNLTKVAQVRDIDVLNLNDLANSLKMIALPGELMEVKIVKPGEELDQGVGYLPDGTMVVVENGRGKIGKDVLISITSSLQTAQGKMIFGKFEEYTSRKENNGNHSQD
ncbi:MAG: hypothetical protein JW804_07030 [Sedimentisphaerales bacterium]|nr:hypothetical protein [Sedimentisphaerales bacterium]